MLRLRCACVGHSVALEHEVPCVFNYAWAVGAVRVIMMLDSMEVFVEGYMSCAELCQYTGLSALVFIVCWGSGSKEILTCCGGWELAFPLMNPWPEQLLANNFQGQELSPLAFYEARGVLSLVCPKLNGMGSVIPGAALTGSITEGSAGGEGQHCHPPWVYPQAS